jgi:hypothetical protein
LCHHFSHDFSERTPEGQEVSTMPRPAPNNGPASTTDPPTLLAILIGARRTGDLALENVTRRALQEIHGITVQFAAEAERAEGQPCRA